MKVAELTGAKLDYWVGKAEGLNVEIGPHGECMLLDEAGDEICDEYFPSTDWSQGGPIIERENIRWQPTPLHKEAYYCWKNWENVHEEPLYGEHGSTLLEAAMRCFVASKFGEDVPDGN